MENIEEKVDTVVYWIRLPEHTDIMTQGYVGYTVDFDRRMRGHSKTLTRRIGISWDKLIKSVIVEYNTINQARAYEQYLRYKPMMGWNIAKGGGGGNALGTKHTDETIAKMRAAHLGKKHTDEHRAKLSAAGMGAKNPKYKGAMIGTDTETGEILHRFEGGAAAKAAGFAQNHIYAVINGKRKTHKGYTWERGTVQPADSQEIKGAM